MIAFVVVAAVVIATPGQDTALTIRNALSGGRRAGIATAAGVACGQAVWTLAASVGLAAIVAASQPLFDALKLAGAGYLVLLGLQSLRDAARRRTRPRLAPAAPLATARAFRQGLLSNLGNPKMVVFFTSLLPQFGGASVSGLAVLGLLFCSMTFAWLALYAVVVDRVGDVLRAPTVRRALDAVVGAALVAFGVRLATTDR